MGEPVELHTQNTTYRLAPTASGSGLEHRGWGPTGAVPDPLGPPATAGFDTPDDLIAHEFGVAGTRHVLESIEPRVVVDFRGGPRCHAVPPGRAGTTPLSRSGYSCAMDASDR